MSADGIFNSLSWVVNSFSFCVVLLILLTCENEDFKKQCDITTKQGKNWQKIRIFQNLATRALQWQEQLIFFPENSFYTFACRCFDVMLCWRRHVSISLEDILGNLCVIFGGLPSQKCCNTAITVPISMKHWVCFVGMLLWTSDWCWF